MLNDQQLPFWLRQYNFDWLKVYELCNASLYHTSSLLSR
jgi:hypothetical protein